MYMLSEVDYVLDYTWCEPNIMFVTCVNLYFVIEEEEFGGVFVRWDYRQSEEDAQIFFLGVSDAKATDYHIVCVSVSWLQSHAHKFPSITAILKCVCVTHRQHADHQHADHRNVLLLLFVDNCYVSVCLCKQEDDGNVLLLLIGNYYCISVCFWDTASTERRP